MKTSTDFLEDIFNFEEAMTILYEFRGNVFFHASITLQFIESNREVSKVEKILHKYGRKLISWRKIYLRKFYILNLKRKLPEK